jgi:hypothetical protein
MTPPAASFAPRGGTSRLRAKMLTAAAAALIATGASAQQTAPVPAGDPELFVVFGLAPGDELNLRATPSGTGMRVGRVPPGTMVRNLGCEEAGGYVWCRVADTGNQGLEGWAAGRYLVGESLGDLGLPLAEPEPVRLAPLEDPASKLPPEVAALLSEPDVDATATVPCAREVGEPMSLCAAKVRRTGDGAAEVTVMWTDGSSRTLQFRNGEAEGSDSSAVLSVTREAGLNIIRVGEGERFEIADAVVFGS